jgi:hypothetical protein
MRRLMIAQMPCPIRWGEPPHSFGTLWEARASQAVRRGNAFAAGTRSADGRSAFLLEGTFGPETKLAWNQA